MPRFMLDIVGQSRTLAGNGSTNAFQVTTGKVMNILELSEVQGRPWDDVDVCNNGAFGLSPLNGSR